jgi:hypothetical protein
MPLAGITIEARGYLKLDYYYDNDNDHANDRDAKGVS